MIWVKLYYYIKCIYRYVSTNPAIVSNYNAPIKDMEKQKKVTSEQNKSEGEWKEDKGNPPHQGKSHFKVLGQEGPWHIQGSERQSQEQRTAWRGEAESWAWAPGSEPPRLG